MNRRHLENLRIVARLEWAIESLHDGCQDEALHALTDLRDDLERVDWDGGA